MQQPICGVYAILNLLNGKKYIGSAFNIHNRWKHHRWQLRNGKHHSQYLQRSYDKNGVDNYLYFLLEKATHDTVLEREQFWIERLRATDPGHGYNTCPTAGNSAGTKWTEQRKHKHSELMKGNKHCVGKTLSEEHRKKVGDGLRGKKHSPEWCKAISKGRKGKHLGPLSEEHKLKLSLATKGRPKSEEWKAKMTGRKRPEEECQAIRERALSQNGYTVEEIRGMRKMKAEGVSTKDIAAHYGRTRSPVHRIVTGQAYQWVL